MSQAEANPDKATKAGRPEPAQPPVITHRSLKKSILLHLACLLIVLEVPIFFLPKPSCPPPAMTTDALKKAAWYEQHARQFDLVFIGDSRTLCAMEPDVYDRLLGCRSVNLAVWANWFPTQYPNIKDIIRHIPTNTAVIWSIGHQNFDYKQKAINRTFPISPPDAVRYLTWGYTWDELRDNATWAASLDPRLHYIPGLLLYSQRAYWRQKLFGPLLPAVPAVQPTTSALPPMTQDQLRENARLAEEALMRHTAHTNTARAAAVREGDLVTSIEVWTTRGGYIREELVPEFFRMKQREHAAGLKPLKGDRFTPEPSLWNTFEAILEIFKSSGVRLIVNEVEEAPYQYRAPGRKEYFRTFMREVVEPRVRSSGFDYVRADFDALNDTDYFDFNHLNSAGITNYARLLAPELAPRLQSR